MRRNVPLEVIPFRLEPVPLTREQLLANIHSDSLKLQRRVDLLNQQREHHQRLVLITDRVERAISRLTTRPLPGLLEVATPSDSGACFMSIDQAFQYELEELSLASSALVSRLVELVAMLEELDADEANSCMAEMDENISEDIKQAVKARRWIDIKARDDFRVPNGYSSGGLGLYDEPSITKLRSVAKEILKELGRKILSGDFNLTRVSFPIRCMQANTALHNALKTQMMNPVYLNRACATSNPVERMKLFIVCSICSYYHTSTFIKPLNPVLGETLYATLEDGTELYAEQTSHHPPVSHYYVQGQKYKAYGYLNFSAKASLNSVTISNSGRKYIEFEDGQLITANCADEVFSGSFYGTIRHESLGVLTYEDRANRLSCAVTIGKVRGKPSDYMQGDIVGPSGVIAKLTGTYLGYMDFDGERYWDVRHVTPSQVHFKPNLPSDSEERIDLQMLRIDQIDNAQRAKEDLENLQRHDRKLREKLGPRTAH